LKSKELALGGLLTAFAILIPLAFGGVLGVTIPPFSATLASHVPVMLAMLISPAVAVMVGLGSGLGFLLKLGPIIAARAATHAIWGYLGAKIIENRMPLRTALIMTLPVHALIETGVVVILAGFTLTHALYLVGLGTALHHIMDSLIAIGIAISLKGLFGNRIFNVRAASLVDKKIT
jgi:niacin transporter